MNSLEQFHHALYTFEKAKKEKEITGSSEEVESPILNMDFDFPDVPPPINTQSEASKADSDRGFQENEEQFTYRYGGI
ncbi:14945_t:CDS:2 [Funneliformis caledonium]|uniref:14945_t:CDS:1 n=1 Tax=Funneliformis caledonium TaxID=1117310 RepID=A0A9N9D1U4_9GLOM|nr:14945_t:CDS:2 [Funneliformis caledonium]